MECHAERKGDLSSTVLSDDGQLNRLIDGIAIGTGKIPICQVMGKKSRPKPSGVSVVRVHKSSSARGRWGFLLLAHPRAHQRNCQRTAGTSERDVEDGCGRTCRMRPEGDPDVAFLPAFKR